MSKKSFGEPGSFKANKGFSIKRIARLINLYDALLIHTLTFVAVYGDALVNVNLKGHKSFKASK